MRKLFGYLGFFSVQFGCVYPYPLVRVVLVERLHQVEHFKIKLGPLPSIRRREVDPVDVILPAVPPGFFDHLLEGRPHHARFALGNIHDSGDLGLVNNDDIPNLHLDRRILKIDPHPRFCELWGWVGSLFLQIHRFDPVVPLR